MGGDEYLAHIFRYFRHILDTAFSGNGIHQLRVVKSPFPGHFFKIRIDFQQTVVVHHGPHKTQREQGLDTAGATGEDTQRPRGGDGRCGCVAIAHALVFKNAVFIIFKDAPLLGQLA